MGEDVELLGLYWTVSGPVVVHFGREWSLFSWADRCAEAERVGFAGLGLWHADLEHLLETQSLRELRAILDAHGLRHVELEFLMDWFLDPGDERRQASDRNRRLLFDAAAALGAHHVKVGNIPGVPAELPQLTERFAELCADAARPIRRRCCSSASRTRRCRRPIYWRMARRACISTRSIVHALHA